MFFESIEVNLLAIAIPESFFELAYIANYASFDRSIDGSVFEVIIVVFSYEDLGISLQLSLSHGKMCFLV